MHHVALCLDLYRDVFLLVTLKFMNFFFLLLNKIGQMDEILYTKSMLGLRLTMKLIERLLDL